MGGEDAMSYFVGAEAMKNDKYKGEDAGFAINGGKGWKDVTFRNHKIDLNGPTAHRWVTTSSPTRPPATRCASSTPSATSATTTTRCASSCTTRRSTTRRRPHSMPRALM